MYIMCNVITARKLIPSNVWSQRCWIFQLLLYQILCAHTPHPHLKLRKASQILTRWSTSVSKSTPKSVVAVDPNCTLSFNTVVKLSHREVSVMISSWSFSWTRQEHEDSVLWPQEPGTQPDESGPTVISRGNVYFS